VRRRRRCAPHPAGHELKRPRRNLLAGAGNADNDALTPAAMAAFQRRAHELHIAYAFEGAVGAADWSAPLLVKFTRWATRSPPTSSGLTKYVMPKRSPQAFLSGLRSTPMIMSAPTQPLDDVEPDPAETEDDDIGAGLYLGGIDHCADAGGDAAADIADLVKWRVFADLRDGDLGQDGEIRKG